MTFKGWVEGEYVVYRVSEIGWNVRKRGLMLWGGGKREKDKVEPSSMKL